MGKEVRFFMPIKLSAMLADMLASADLSPAVSRRVARKQPQKQQKEPLYTGPPPGLVGELYPFQLYGAQMAASQDSFLLSDDMGLGKTVQALSALAYRDAYPALIVCPSSVKNVWAQEVEKFFPSLTVSVVDGTASQRRAAIQQDACVVIINFEALRLHPELANWTWDAVVVDEHHRVKNIGAKQTRALLAIHAKYKLLMSGTPILNGRLEELWPPLHYAFPEDFPGNLNTRQPDWLFRRRYCIVRNGYIVAYKNVAELRYKLHSVSLRRRKEEVLKDLPDIVYSVRQVELNPEQRKLYNSIRDEMVLWMDDGGRKRIPDTLARLTRLKQACFSPELYEGAKTSAKLDELKNLVAEITKAGHKVIIFSQWSKAARIIQRELKDYPHSYVDGSVPTKKRRNEIAAFQAPGSNRLLYIGTIGANKEGITLTAASYVIFTDLDWVPANNEQAAARAHRIGQKDVVNVIELQAVNTVEEGIARVLKNKEAMNAFMTERGNTELKQSKVIDSLRDILQDQSGRY